MTSFEEVFFKIGDGRRIRFWEDIWLGDSPLSSQYPSLYGITNWKNVSVFDVLSTAPPLNMSFRRALVGDKWDAWSHLCIRLMDVRLEETSDHFAWSLTALKEFTVKSMYEDFL